MDKLLISCVLLCAVVFVNGNCPVVKNKEDFIFMIGAVCYHYIEGTDEQPVRYDSAEGDCRSRNGHLLTIADSDTQTALMARDKLGRVSDSHTIVLGLRNFGGEWKWASGVPTKYLNWNTNMTSATGNCVKMVLKNSGSWERFPCALTEWYYAYVCEYDPNNGSLPVKSSWAMMVIALISTLTLARSFV